MGNKGKRYSPKFQFQVVLEVLKGDREAVEIARAYNIHPTTDSRWKQEFLVNGAEVFGKDKTVARYEKRIKELEQLLGRKEMSVKNHKYTKVSKMLLDVAGDFIAMGEDLDDRQQYLNSAASAWNIAYEKGVKTLDLASSVRRGILEKMIRPLRIEYPGAWYHVMSRGNSGQDIFISDKDRGSFLEAEFVNGFGTPVGWAFMGSGVHSLLIEVPPLCFTSGQRSAS